MFRKVEKCAVWEAIHLHMEKNETQQVLRELKEAVKVLNKMKAKNIFLLHLALSGLKLF